jgi:hypothetical protein
VQATRVSVLSRVALPPAMRSSRKLARHLGVAGLVEGGEVLAVGNCHAAAPGKPSRLPDGANHQLPPDILTEDGEAEPNRPAEQRLVGVDAGTWTRPRYTQVQWTSAWPQPAHRSVQ